MHPLRIVCKLLGAHGNRWLLMLLIAGLVLPVLVWPSPVAAQSLEVVLSDGDGEPVADAVIELLLPADLRAQFQAPAERIIDQIDKEFVPHVTTIVAGGEIGFPNSDAILHHVYSFSSPRTFNIPLYGRGENDGYRETFPDSGVVEIGCNIHDWMLAYIYIGESQLTAISTASGRAVLADPPAGDFQLKIWHAQLDEPGNVMVRDISLIEGESTTIEVQFSLQRDRRIRRAPSANRNRYR